MISLTKQFMMRSPLLPYMSDVPDPPSSLPAYIADGLPKQDTDTLHDVIAYAETLIDYANVTPDDVDDLDTNDDIVDVQEDSNRGTIVTKKVACGKDACNSCPHGPYDYRVYRKDGNVKWDYVGKHEE
jgi:hypothetical protein